MARRARISHEAGYRHKKVGIHVEVRRDVSLRTGQPRFSACGWVGGKRTKPGYACEVGRNPRIAVANTLRRLASNISGRRGAFAEFGGYSKNHRKRRRSTIARKRRY